MQRIPFPFRPLHTAGRFGEILSILIKYGFDDVAENLGFKRLKFFNKKQSVAEHHTTWQKLRLAVEELGPTTIKIGQLLSMRPDLIPIKLCDEFKRLQEDVYQETYDDMVKVVESSLGQPLSEMFAVFDRTPTAAASLSQVHRGVLLNGKEVAVKIKRPDIDGRIMSDLDILETMAGILHERIEAFKPIDLPAVVAELRKTLTRELDFTNETRSIILFNTFFKDEPRIFAPAVHETWCTEDVLVMDFITGSRIDTFDGDEQQRKAIAEIGLDAAVKQLLELGFFHADPHMGNIRIVDKTRICYLDWGMVGRLTTEMRSALIDYILALTQNDSKKIATVAITMAAVSPPLVDFQRLQTDIMFALDKIQAPLEGQINLGRFLLDLTVLCRNHGIFLRSDYILMARALISIEAVGRTVFPEFDAIGRLKPVAARYLARRYSLFSSDKPLFGDIEETIRTVGRLPIAVDHVLKLIETGNLTMHVVPKDQPAFFDILRRVGNRVASALIMAGLIIGSSMIVTSNTGPHYNNIPIFGLVGFTISGLVGFVMAINIFFRGK
ncbi:ABC1 kinase family protein [Desulfovibrio inopinatus]|uniref:ABC1 kinase family protein n=1 Tax=Desulfovibrio inopinatus TaxID=102109 RepID=UPI000425C085|nr:AarF/UbiB family protein [Desulfovibrio inopinatus]